MSHCRGSVGLGCVGCAGHSAHGMRMYVASDVHHVPLPLLQILLMPTLVLAARLCPEGVEATLYASLMSLNNAAVGVADMLGALMMKLFGITSSNFVYLSALLVTCNVLSLVPLPLIGWVPDESTKVVESLGDYELVSAADVVNDDAEEHQHHDGEDVKAGRSEGQV